MSPAVHKMARKVTILSLLLGVSVLVNSACGSHPAAQDDCINNMCFHGGHYQELIPEQEQAALHIQFCFRSLQNSGLLMIAKLAQTKTDYIAVTLQRGSIVEVLLKQARTVSALGSAPFRDVAMTPGSRINWHTFQLELINGSLLNMRLNNLTFVTHHFTPSLLVPEVLLGGPESFFDPFYRDFPVPHYFIGCLTGLNVNGREVTFAAPLPPGLSQDCCLAPRYPMWCLNSSAHHLTLNTPHVLNSTEHVSIISFRLQSRDDEGGLVLTAGATDSPSWGLYLLQQQLQVMVNVSGHVETLECPSRVSEMDGWHQIEIGFNPTIISCGVDGVLLSLSLPSLVEWPILSALQLGGTRLAAHAGGLEQHESGRGFVGCFQKLRLNGFDIDISLLENAESFVSVIQPVPIKWPVLNNNTELLVTAGMDEILSTDDILLQFPRDEFNDNLTALYQIELENAIHFEVLFGPQHGHLYQGNQAVQVERFSYADLLIGSPARRVGYSNTDQRNTTDVVVFHVWAVCGDVVLADLSKLALVISIEPRENTTTIRKTDLSLAVGSRKTITPSVITVEDSLITNPTLIVFSVQSIALQESVCSFCQGDECSECMEEEKEEGGFILKNGTRVKFFDQAEIDRGLISYQHYEKLSTAAIIIRLSVTTQEEISRRFDISILVRPFEGHISLNLSPLCVYVKEGGLAFLGPRYLNATTDFSEQDPIITYHLLTLPHFGVLQRYEPLLEEWVDLNNSSGNGLAPLGTFPNSFTQREVNSESVRYSQSLPYSSANLDKVQLQVQSYNLSGPKRELCVDIVPDPHLVQPSIVVTLAELSVLEGGSATINSSTIHTDLDDMDYSTEPEIQIQQLGVVYTIVETPSFGSLKLRGEVLTAGDVFTYSDITSHELIYVHNGTEHHMDQFSFYAESTTTAYLVIRAPNRTSNLTLSINIIEINDNPPTLTVLEDIEAPEGCWVEVTAANINITDLDQGPVDLKVYLRKPRHSNQEPTGFFAFKGSRETPVRSFLMQDILDGKIIFQHQLGLKDSLNYTQVLRIEDGNDDHTFREPIHINAVPLDLQVLVHTPQNNCIATLDADHTLQVSFDPAHFSATLGDKYGINAALVPNITVHIKNPPHHGVLSMETVGQGNDTSNSNNVTQISKFAFRELSKILYVLREPARNQTTDEFLLEFEYGHSVPVLHSLQVCIKPNFVPTAFEVSPLIVKQHCIGHLDTNHLIVSTSRPEEIDSLEFLILRGPQHGSIVNQMDDSSNLTSFTYAQLKTRAILYENDKNSTAFEDSVLLDVCSLFACFGEQVLLVHIYPVNLTVNNTEVHVREGGMHRFSLRDFNIFGPPDYDVISFVIDLPPHSGRLYVEIDTESAQIDANYFSLDDIKLERVVYNNTVMEQLSDSFTVSVLAANSEAATNSESMKLEFIMTIIIDQVNNFPPEVYFTQLSLEVVQKTSLLITSDHLYAIDRDAGTEDVDLVWKITIAFLPHSGYMYLEDNPDVPVKQWTEGDIRSNRLFYHNTEKDNVNQEDFIIVNVTDGGPIAANSQLKFKIVDAKIKRNSFTSFEVVEGGSGRITYQHLRHYAEERELSDSQFDITLTSTPQHGTLTLDGVVIMRGSTFPQSAINSKELVYQHDHSNTESTNFTYRVTIPDLGNSSTTDIFTITIQQVDDDAPVATLTSPLYVVELERTLIDSSVIDIEDSDSKTIGEMERVVCRLVQPLASGHLEKNRADLQTNNTDNFNKYDLEPGPQSSLWYRHLGSPLIQPEQLLFNVTDGVNDQPEVYNLTIIILPRIIPLQLRKLTVTEGKVASITKDEISIDHYFLETASGNFTVLEGPRHGHLLHKLFDSGTSVQGFTTEDVSRELISYLHNGNERKTDSFTFVYEALEPAPSMYGRRSRVETFHIEILPVNDEVPIIADNMTSLRLWATETVVLSDSYLNVSDYDTSASRLNITFQISDLRGYIAFSTAPAVFIQWFTMADIQAGRVLFVHEDGPTGKMLYNVTDGDHTASGNITIIADRLTLECDTNNWAPIVVTFQESVVLTSRSISCTTTDETEDREITYEVIQSELGHFEVNSDLRSSFSATEVRNGRVRYVQSETRYWREKETLLISASSPPASEETNLPLQVVVRYPIPPPGSSLAVNNMLTVLEGGTQCIDETLLDGRNLRYMKWLELNSTAIAPDELTILYQISRSPSHGVVSINDSAVPTFTQSDLAESSLVCYTHDDSETHTDGVGLTVFLQVPTSAALSDTTTAIYEEEFTIQIHPVNDQSPVLLTPDPEKTVVENFSYPLLPGDLEVFDNDSSPVELHIQLLSLPSNSHIFLNGALLTENSTFTQEDIALERVTIQPFSTGTESFSFTFTDGSVSNPRLGGEFRLRVEKHMLSLAEPKQVTVINNQHYRTISYLQTESSKTITTEYLNASTNAQRQKTRFSIISAPKCGSIKIGNVEVSSFLQEDVDQERVSYILHRRAEHYRDEFSLSITNNNLSLPEEKFLMRVLALVSNNASKEHTVADLKTSPFYRLPRDILNLDELAAAVGRLPTIAVLEGPQYGPQYGHLERHVVVGHLEKRSTAQVMEFGYEDLKEGWIVYVWDYNQPLTNTTVEDSFTVLVWADEFPPGEATISLVIVPPPAPPTMEDVSSPTSPSTPLHSASVPAVPVPAVTDDGSAFPVLTLVPIIGIILFLIILIVIVVLFCLTQQKRIKKKWVPNMAQPRHPSPWSASPPLPPCPVTHYELDPSAIPPGSEEDHHQNSDTSSGFSEPDGSPRQSPTSSFTYSSPLYREHHHHHSNPPHPPRSRMRSNVSITFSSREFSTASEMSLEEDHMHSYPHYPPQPAPPLPTSTLSLRPTSLAAGTPPALADTASHIISTSSAVPQDGSTNGSRAAENKEASQEDGFLDWPGSDTLPDFNDPNIQRLFHAPNPVLKKEEYWV